MNSLVQCMGEGERALFLRWHNPCSMWALGFAYIFAGDSIFFYSVHALHLVLHSNERSAFEDCACIFSEATLIAVLHEGQVFPVLAASGAKAMHASLPSTQPARWCCGRAPHPFIPPHSWVMFA